MIESEKIVDTGKVDQAGASDSIVGNSSVASDNTGLMFAIVLVCLCSLFIVYGSWLPFKLDPAWQTNLASITQAKLYDNATGVWSEWWHAVLWLLQPVNWQTNVVDITTNLLLTIPLAFAAGAALLFAVNTPWQRYQRMFVIWLYCSLLALIAELGQLVLQGRVASGSDVIAQSLGACIGLLLWARCGGLVWPLVTQFSQELQRGSIWYRIGLLYCLLFLLYNLTPFDLSVHPADIYDKWKVGLITVLPFQYPQQSLPMLVYAMVSDALVWVPLACILQRACRNGQQMLWYLFCYSLLTELLQLFVLSRSTDSTDVVLALLVGVVVRQIMPQVAPQQEENSHFGFWASLWLLWTTVLLFIFWYPFDFSVTHLRMQDRSWWSLPFSELMQDSLLTAVTTMMQKILLWAPIGAILCMWQHGNHRFIRLILLALVLGQTVLLEMGQRFLAGKVSTITDILLACLGIGCGFVITAMFRATRLQRKVALHLSQQTSKYSPTKQTSDLRMPTIPAVEPTEVAERSSAIQYKVMLHLLSSTLVLWFCSQLEVVPYNVRELLGQGNLVQTAGVTFALYWCFTALSIWLNQLRWPAPLTLIGMLLLHGQIMFWLLYLAVPLEVLEDVVGAAHWKVAPVLEMAARFSALFLVLQMAMLFVAIRRHPKRIMLLASWTVLAPVSWLIWHFVVIVWANTDNLTELFAGGGTWYSSLLFWLWLLLLIFCADLCWKVINTLTSWPIVGLPAGVLRAVFAAAGFYLSLPLLSAALAKTIYKYQQEFSALQFLLSPNRQQYLNNAELTERYYLAVIGLMLLLCWLHSFMRCYQPDPQKSIFTRLISLKIRAL